MWRQVTIITNNGPLSNDTAAIYIDGKKQTLGECYNSTSNDFYLTDSLYLARYTAVIVIILAA